MCQATADSAAVNILLKVLIGARAEACLLAGVARLFYHRPALAVLDECTNTLSVSLVERMYLYNLTILSNV
jgi:hypothetical protein